MMNIEVIPFNPELGDVVAQQNGLPLTSRTVEEGSNRLRDTSGFYEASSQRFLARRQPTKFRCAVVVELLDNLGEMEQELGVLTTNYVNLQSAVRSAS